MDEVSVETLKMSEEKPITKSFLEQKIHEKAVEHWKSDVQRVFSSFRNPFFDNLLINKDLREKLNTGNEATLQSTLSGDYNYNEQEKFLRYLCPNYDEVKEKTIKKYEQNKTDMILNSLSALGDYLNDDRRY